MVSFERSLVAIVGCFLMGFCVPQIASGQTTYLAQATISLNPGRTIPADYSGIAYEWTAARYIAGAASTGKNEIYRQLLRNLAQYGNVPIIIRIGGDSTDSVTALQNVDLESINDLYTDMNGQVKFMLGINMGSDSTTIATNEVNAIRSAIPASAIVGLEMGNEPDTWGERGLRPGNYTYTDYRTQMQQWETLIANDSQSTLNSVSPAFAGTQWKPSFMSDLANLNLSSTIVTQHYYPGGPGQADNFLLLDTSSTFGPYHLTSYINSAHAAGKTWCADELNSIYSGGQAGLSDTFSSALWAIDIAFEFAQDGADGVNWHIDNGGPTAFFSVTETQDPTTRLIDYTLNHVYPLYYGVQMLAAATASHGALLPVTLSTSANIKVWALQGEDGLVRVVVLNKTQSTSGSVSVTLPGYSTGEVVRLLAPSYLSTSGVTLGGQTYDGTTDGTIRGTAVTTAVAGSNGTFVLNMPAASAALITLSKASQVAGVPSAPTGLTATVHARLQANVNTTIK